MPKNKYHVRLTKNERSGLLDTVPKIRLVMDNLNTQFCLIVV
jgi:hypothetical protein